MKYFYIAKHNVFKDGEKVGEKIAYTSKDFDNEKTCRDYGFQYAWQQWRDSRIF